MGLTQRLDLEEAFDVKTSAVRSSSCPVPGEVRKAKPPPPPPPPPPPKAPEKIPSIPSEPLSRSTGFAAEKMRANGFPDGLPTTWLRVVHSGYGSQAWLQDLKDSPLVHVTTARHQEGIYVVVPPGGSVADLVGQLMAMNLAVRKKTQFKEMKRSNKSRLQFKATVTVYPTEREQTERDGALAPLFPEEPESHSSNGDTEPLGQTKLEQMERQYRSGPQQPQPPGPSEPQYLFGYLPPGNPPSQGIRLEHTVNPNYWNMPNTYEWDEKDYYESPVVPQRNAARTNRPHQQGGYHPQMMPGFFPGQPPAQQPGMQPVYVCVGMMPTGWGPQVQ